ncbi:MAG: cytochrome c [Chloroflexi bacterium]|nr:cytochrome c [Chloroflexota bacterium]MBI3761107.1 cytochrome c [Chloroflexota bacterium]
MKRLPPGLIRVIQYIAIITLALGVFLAVIFSWGARTAHALPEYAARTGEPCATCHVSPGGGGPRTLRGLLWAARGRPDKVPTLPGLLIAPGVRDGAELFDIACAACHGSKGEGLFAIGLVRTGVSKPAVRSFVQHGIPGRGMPAFEGQFTDAQLEALVTFVAGLADGEIEPLPDSYPLPPARFTCKPVTPTARCGGN